VLTVPFTDHEHRRIEAGRMTSDETAGRNTSGRARRSRGRRAIVPQPQATLRRLLDTGPSLLAEVGFNALSIDDIVRTARVSRATFYLFFKEKQDYLRALVVASFDPTIEVSMSLPPYVDDPSWFESLESWVAAMAEANLRWGGVWQAWDEEQFNDPSLLLLRRSCRRRVDEHYRTVLASSPATIGHDPAVGALALSSVVDIFAFLPAGGRKVSGQDVSSLARFLFQGIATPDVALPSSNQRPPA
jgi:AcrR family transcriptional regulator